MTLISVVTHSDTKTDTISCSYYNQKLRKINNTPPFFLPLISFNLLYDPASANLIMFHVIHYRHSL